MKIYRGRLAIPVLMLAAVLLAGIPAGALAQCGGGSMGSIHDQHMGSSGHMGSGQMGMYGGQVQNRTPLQPGYVSPAPPPVSGYAASPNPGGYGQVTGQGGTAGDHSGHKH